VRCLSTRHLGGDGGERRGIRRCVKTRSLLRRRCEIQRHPGQEDDWNERQGKDYGHVAFEVPEESRCKRKGHFGMVAILLFNIGVCRIETLGLRPFRSVERKQQI
jgi:hypothetical protein